MNLMELRSVNRLDGGSNVREALIVVQRIGPENLKREFCDPYLHLFHTRHYSLFYIIEMYNSIWCQNSEINRKRLFNQSKLQKHT